MDQENIDALLLSPRLVATGAPASSSLENINTNVLGDGALCYVIGGPGQGEWQLQKGSTNTPDGTTIVAPTAGPGRWFKKSSSGVGPIVPNSNPPNTFLNSQGEWLVPGNPPGEALELWVDGTNGTLTGTGTQLDPFLTLAQVATRVGMFVWQETTVHLLNSPPGGFLAAELNGLRQIAAEFRILGEDGFTEHFPVTAVDSQTGLVLSCATAAPAWSVDQWLGYKVEMLDGAGDVIAYRSIVENTTNSITIAASTSDGRPVASLRVVRPSTEISSTVLTISVGVPGPPLVVNQVSLANGSVRTQIATHWENIHFVGNGLVVGGVHNFVGTTADADWFVNNPYGAVFSGVMQLGALTDYARGNGLACARGTFSSSKIFGSLVGSRVSPNSDAAACVMLTTGVRLTADLASAIVAHRENGGGFLISGSATVYAGLGAPTGAGSIGRSLELYGALVRLVGPITIFSVASEFITAEGNAMVRIESATFDFRTAAGQIFARQNANVRLSGRDYAELGTCTIGTAPNTLTRPAGAWAVGDSVVDGAAAFTDLPKDGAPAIYRA